MNISTGGGTLVHEIVHPFVAANFPNCPAWFNEGLGSLYEQSGEVEGEIHGFTNWRLPRLQEAIRKGKLASFKTLCHTTDTEFYEKDRGTNYAQARYLCYYLQQKDLLQDLLSPLPGEPQGRSLGLQDLEGRPGTRRHGGVPKAVGVFCAEAQVSEPRLSSSQYSLATVVFAQICW